MLLDLLDQVVRHRGLEPVAADEDEHARGLRGEEDRGLPGGVRAADDDHGLVLAGLGLGERRAVVDAAAVELLDARRVEPPVGDAGGHEQRVPGELGPVRERHHALRAAGLERAHLLHREQLRAEAACLVVRAAREVGAREPVGEAEVVLDPRATGRPGRPAPRAPRAPCAGPPTRRTRRRRGRLGRRRRSRGRRSRARPASGCRTARRAPAGSAPRARCRRAGRRRAAGPPGCPRRRAAAGPRASRSRSNHAYGTRLRARKSRTSCDCGENRWPTTRAAASLSRASASQSPRRSSSVGYSRSSGGSHGFCR